MPHLFDSLKLREVVLPNRIGVTPMCQYSATDGMADDWHFVHYGSRAVGGAGLVVIEATATSPEGRISPSDLGLWEDRQIEPLARIARFTTAHGSVPSLQLSHAGRKASKTRNWRVGSEGQRTLDSNSGGWATYGPSAMSFGEGHAIPEELDVGIIRRIISDFAAAADRALEAGIKVLEVHGAHGYLLHQFLSPLSNQRQDGYGGSFENRCRFTLEVVAAVRDRWPERLPLLVRLSAHDWAEGGWSLDETVELSGILRGMGVDLIDVSSGGLIQGTAIPTGPGYQTAFSARVRAETGVNTATVGLISSAHQADHIIRTGQADLVFIGREALSDPYWPLRAARTLGHPSPWPQQYLRAAPAGSEPRQALS